MNGGIVRTHEHQSARSRVRRGLRPQGGARERGEVCRVKFEHERFSAETLVMARSQSRKGIAEPGRNQRRPPRRPCAGRWPGPGTASRSTWTRRRSCSTPAARTCSRLLDYASRTRDAGLESAATPRRHHLLAEGLHPAHPAVPGPLRLLHVRDRPAPAGQPVPGAGSRSWTSPARGPNSAARKPCSPWVTSRRTAGARPANGWTRTATTTPCPTSGRWRSACSRRPACCRT